ncbi:MAG: DNA primase [Actinobacteria bacterium]|nr:DNA primase [Actinomycetota bacterium]
MPRYTDDSKEKVRDAVDMIALVSTRTELRRAGVNSYFGRCPFHDERTGSFHVRPEEKHYHCFGCQASGDPFDFVMESEGLDFVGAMESLAGRFGVTLEVADEDPQARARRERRERLHTLLDRAAAYYARYLWEAAEAGEAREYLAGRGLEEATLKTYRVGYAPSAWDKLLLVARQAGFSEDELLATGLAQRSKQQRGQIYDRFRGRIMFPLADARGRVVGFGARAMRENQPPKYLNTSEGEVFHKGSQLFGIDLARRAAARAGSVVLAEGYTDVLALHQTGIENAVGIMGTSFTDEQAAELERTARTLVLALDADGAGQEAMLRAARVAEGRKLELRVVALPAGLDPADLVQREGVEAMRERIARSVPFVEFHVERVLARAEVGSAEGKDRALEELRPLLGPLPASVLRDELVRRIAGRLDLSDQLAASLLGEGAAVALPGASTGHAHASALAAAPSGPSGGFGSGRHASVAPPPVPVALDRRERGERTFLALCVAFPREGRALLEEADLAQHFSSDLARRAAAHLLAHAAAPLDGLPDDDPELATYVSELDARAARGGSARPGNLEHAWLTLELARLERAIERARHAAGAGTEGAPSISSLSAEREQVRTRLRHLSGRLQSA